MANINLPWLRLEEIIKHANMSVNSFGRHIGLTRSESLYQIKAGRFGISHNLAQRIIEKFPDISLGWLLSGEGEMFCNTNPTQAIPYYDQDISACRHLSSEQLRPTAMLSLPMIEACDCAFRSFDTSISSQIIAGSIVFLKKTDPQSIIPGRFYVVITSNFVILRKVRISECGTECILEASDEGQDSIKVKKQDILGLYRVVSSLAMY